MASPLPVTPEAADADTGHMDLEAAVAPERHPKKDWRKALQIWIIRESTIVWDMLLSSYLNLLLLLVPVALGLGFAHSQSVAVFVLNFIALVPLALLLGDVTEHLAERFGDVIGGLLNATFGNVVEIVLAIQALRKDLVMLVEMSLVGSVLSNLLMVLGFIFATGGYFHHTQTFSVDSMQAQFALIFLAVISLCLPTAAPFFNAGMKDNVEAIGHGSAVLCLCSYLLYLVFQLYTHPEVGARDDDDDDDASQADEGSPEHQALRDEEGDQPTELALHPSGQAHGLPPHHPMLPSVASGRELSKVDQLPIHYAALKGPNASPFVGRSASGRPSDGEKPAATAGVASADTLRARTRSGPIDATATNRQGSGGPPGLFHSGSVVRPYTHVEAGGKPIELIKTASGRVVEMVRSDSGRLVELHGALDRPSRRAGSRTMSGRSAGGHHTRTGSGARYGGDRSASGRYIVRTESGRQMTDLELVELNRARRISGRAGLRPIVVVSNPAVGAHPPVSTDKADSDGALLTDVGAVSASPKVEVKSIDDAILSVPMAILLLAGLAALIAIHCEFLTDAIQDFGDITGLTQPFIGLILVPIAGNVCEHLASVVMACKGRMNLALGIAIGSATQISLLCIPLLVIIAWGMGKPFNMDIDIYPLFCLIMAVVMAYQLTAAGRSTWLSGIGPCVVYLVIATAYYFNNEEINLGDK